MDEVRSATAIVRSCSWRVAWSDELATDTVEVLRKLR